MHVGVLLLSVIHGVRLLLVKRIDRTKNDPGDRHCPGAA